MNTGDRVKLFDAREALRLGTNKDAIGLILRAGVDEGNIPRMDVQFDGIELLEGWHPAMFEAADPKA